MINFAYWCMCDSRTIANNLTGSRKLSFVVRLSTANIAAYIAYHNIFCTKIITNIYGVAHSRSQCMYVCRLSPVSIFLCSEGGSYIYKRLFLGKPSLWLHWLSKSEGGRKCLLYGTHVSDPWSGGSKFVLLQNSCPKDMR